MDGEGTGGGPRADRRPRPARPLACRGVRTARIVGLPPSPPVRTGGDSVPSPDRGPDPRRPRGHRPSKENPLDPRAGRAGRNASSGGEEGKAVRQTAEKGRIPIALWFSLRAHWVFGLIPLFFLTEIYRLAVAGAAVAFLAGAVLDWTGSPRRRWHKAASPLLAAGAAAAAAEFTLGRGDPRTSVSP